jgi:hypothetical protein
MRKQTDAQRIAKLERELAALKAAQKPPPTPPAFKPLSTEEHIDQMHQARERAANSFQFRPEILREMQNACGTADLRDLVHASHRPQGPSTGGIPSSQQLTGMRPGGGARIPPGSGTGWARQRDFGADGQHPVPGVAAADRLMDEQDRRDRRELAQRLGKNE